MFANAVRQFLFYLASFLHWHNRNALFSQKKKNRKSEERCCSGPGKNEPFSKENIKTCEWSLVASNSASSLHSTVCWLRKPSDITVQLQSTQKILNKFTRGFIIILINFNHKKNIYVKSNII